MEILFFDRLPSTQRWLTEAIRAGEITEPTAVLAREQTRGIGSRNSRWIGHPGNFFASIALRESDLPEDLPPASASIYFGWMMKELLRELGEPVWLKWPNDLYLGSKKAGGVITNRLRSFYVTGIGVNLKKSEKNFAALETELSPMILLDMYLHRLEEPPKWKELFRKYRLEFDRTRAFGAHRGTEYVSLENARLMEDGSIMLDGERIVELR